MELNFKLVVLFLFITEKNSFKSEFIPRGLVIWTNIQMGMRYEEYYPFRHFWISIDHFLAFVCKIERI